MGGGDLNLKKSWHPSTLRNIERVWKAEQKHEVERQKIEQLQKELAEERAREEIQTYAEDHGVVKKREERLDWMYQGPAAMVNRDDYLLGRKIDKTLDLLQQQESGVESKKEEFDVGATMFSSQDLSGTATVDLATKIREDPLFSIMKKEKEQRKNLLSNPVKMKQLQQLDQCSRTKGDRTVRRKITRTMRLKCGIKSGLQNPGLSGSAAEKLQRRTEELSRDRRNPCMLQDSLGKGKSKKSKKHKSSDSDSDERKHHKKHKRDKQHRNISAELEDEIIITKEKSRNSYTKNRMAEDKYERKSLSASYQYKHYNNSYSRDSDYSSKHTHRITDTYSSHKHSSRESHSRSSHREEKDSDDRQKRKKLDAEERERRLREMEENAKWRDQQRERNFKRYKEDEEKEIKGQKIDTSDFIKPMLSKAAEKGSLENRVKQKIFSIQRGNGVMDKHFARR